MMQVVTAIPTCNLKLRHMKGNDNMASANGNLHAAKTAENHEGNNICDKETSGVCEGGAF